jgi:hypothetical protein
MWFLEDTWVGDPSRPISICFLCYIFSKTLLSASAIYIYRASLHWRNFIGVLEGSNPYEFFLWKHLDPSIEFTHYRNRALRRRPRTLGLGVKAVGVDYAEGYRRRSSSAKVRLSGATWALGVDTTLGVAMICQRWPSAPRPSAQATPSRLLTSKKFKKNPNFLNLSHGLF